MKIHKASKVISQKLILFYNFYNMHGTLKCFMIEYFATYISLVVKKLWDQY